MAVQHQGANAVLEAAISQFDADLRVLQVRYEQYFLGIERRAPSDEREALRKGLMALKRENIRNTSLKFRLNSLWNKMLSYERMWNRTVTEIEEGRYRRDVFKAKLRGYDSGKAKAKAGKAAEAATAPSAAEEAPAADSTTENGKSAAPKSARPTPRPPPGGGAPTGLTDDKVDKIFNAFVMAKRKCREDVSGISREALARSLRRQLPDLQAKHGGKTVDFKVVIKGGKAVLKAVPR